MVKQPVQLFQWLKLQAQVLVFYHQLVCFQQLLDLEQQGISHHQVSIQLWQDLEHWATYQVFLALEDLFLLLI